MTPQLINGWKVEHDGRTYEIDLFFPRKFISYYIDLERTDSRQAWVCLCHDWGFLNLYWQILEYEVKNNIKHDFDITVDNLEGLARAMYHICNSRLYKEFYDEP